MKSTTLLLMGGLAFAGTALAGDPTPQQTASPSLKVGIDKATGRLRPLTPTESAALDAQARASRTTVAPGAKTATAQSNRPATMDQALANLKKVKGIAGFQMPEEMMSSLTATRNADGSVTLSEGGEPMQATKTRESASE